MSTSTISAPAGIWELDKVHSTAVFEVSYLAGTFKGAFHDLDAQLDVAETGARLEGAARVESVDVRDDALSAHLRTPDFFDAERHPELRFSAERIALDGEQVKVAGELTIKGVTRQVAATGSATGPLSDPYGNERVGLTLTTTVDRTDFGVSWNVALPGGGKALADEVTIFAELQFVKGQ